MQRSIMRIHKGNVNNGEMTNTTTLRGHKYIHALL